MQISVVVPTYKRPQLLKKCLKALLCQSFDASRYEVIVVSDGPDPETEAEINNLEHNGRSLRHIMLPVNSGPAAARNAGWRAAQGTVIAFTDDDTLPDENWLTEVAWHLDGKRLEAISGRVVVPRSQQPTDYELNTAGLETAEFVTANCAITKAALEAVGGFDERFRMAWREDSDLHFKLMKERIPIRRVHTAIVVHPVREPQWGVSLKEQKKTLFNALLYQKYPRLYRQRIQPSPPVLYYGIIAAFIVMLIGAVTGLELIALGGLFVWAILTGYFIYRRLSKTSKAAGHLVEMFITSLFIPFLSIYWQWYGAVKYRVLFI